MSHFAGLMWLAMITWLLVIIVLLTDHDTLHVSGTVMRMSWRPGAVMCFAFVCCCHTTQECRGGLLEASEATEL